MGSFFAGIKAGTVGGIIYVAGLAAFNVILLFALRHDVLIAINQSNPVYCPEVANANGSVQDCFNLVLSVSVPFISFVSIFVVPLFFGLGLIYAFNLPSDVATAAFLLGWTPVFGYLLGRLYKKYTRAIELSSQDPNLLKVVVDGRDCTGRVKTFATTSSHRLRAEIAEGASFREWVASEGIALEDSRSFETTMEVNNNGRVVGNVGPKY